jgi:hypothetical protein
LNRDGDAYSGIWAALACRRTERLIFDKIGVASRPQAIVWARDAGFGRKPSCE